MDFIYLLFCFLPACVPLLVAAVAKGSPQSIRIVLATAGVTSGLFAVLGVMFGSRTLADGWETLAVPVGAAAITFYISLTGTCLATALFSTQQVGSPLSRKVAFGLFSFLVVAGLFVVFLIIRKLSGR